MRIKLNESMYQLFKCLLESEEELTPTQIASNMELVTRRSVYNLLDNASNIAELFGYMIVNNSGKYKMTKIILENDAKEIEEEEYNKAVYTNEFSLRLQNKVIDNEEVKTIYQDNKSNMAYSKDGSKYLKWCQHSYITEKEENKIKYTCTKCNIIKEIEIK
jgi:hypothetical protein